MALSAARYVITRRSRPYLGIRLRDRLRAPISALLGTVRRTPEADGIVAPPWLTTAAIRLLQHSEEATLFGQRPVRLPAHPTRSRVQDRLIATVPPFAQAIGTEVTKQKLELRFPLLDTRVLRYVFSVPAIPWCQHKELARAAYRGILPDQVLDRPKTPVSGFFEALVRSWRGRLESHGPPAAFVLREWIDERAWRRVLAAGRTNDVMMAWRVMHLDAWLSEQASRPESSCTA